MATPTKRELQLEANIESDIVELARTLGGVALKLIHDGDQSTFGFPRRGIPDRTILMPGGRIVFVEVKRPGGKASMHQLKWHRYLRKLGFEVHVIDNSEKAKEVLE